MYNWRAMNGSVHPRQKTKGRNTMKKRIISLLMAIVLAVSLLPVSVLATENASSGTCGSSLNWTLDSEGVLTISGTGEMTDYTEETPAPWIEYMDSIQVVMIEEGVTSIGEYAFYNCTNLAAVELDNSVITIGGHAFQGDSVLKTVVYIGSGEEWDSIRIGANNSEFVLADYYCSPIGGLLGTTLVWEIDPENKDLIISGEGAMPDFSGVGEAPWCQNEYADSIQSVLVVNGVTGVGNYGLTGLKSVTRVSLQPSVTRIGSHALEDMDSLTELKLPAGIEYVGDYAFSGMDGITCLRLPEGLTHIGDYAFSDMGTLEQVFMSDGAQEMGQGVFADCEKLIQVEFSQTLQKIGNGIFDGCPIEGVVFPETVTSIGNKLLSGSQVKYIAFEGKAPTIEWDEEDATPVFDGFSATVCYPFGDNSWTDAVKDSYGGDIAWVTMDLNEMALYLDYDGEVSLLGLYDFWYAYENYFNTEGTGENTTRAVILGEDVNLVSYDFHTPFYFCNLEEFRVDEANPYYTSVDGVLFTKDMKTIVAYPANKAGESYEIPDGVVTVGEFSFKSTRQLRHVTMADSVLAIEGFAFSQAALDSIVLGNNVESMGDSALSNSTVSSVIIPESCTDMMFDIFSGCENLHTIGPIGGDYDIQFGWKDYIPAYSFCTALGAMYNPYLTSIEIPASIKYIGYYAFHGCPYLSDVAFEDRTESAAAPVSEDSGIAVFARRTVARTDYIAREAFADCPSLEEIVIPEGYTTIDAEAFRGCENLKRVVLPSTITYVGESSFADCPSIEAVVFNGTDEEWANITFEEGNDSFLAPAPIVNYTVTFETNGGSSVDAQKVARGESAVEPAAPTKMGYTFEGWYADAEGTTAYDFTTPVTGDITIYAKWQKNSSSKPSYEASVAQPENGTIKLSSTTVKAGTIVVVTVTPDDGYVLDSLIILDKNGNAVEVTDNGDGTYAFKMPSGDISVEVIFAKTAEVPAFDDVKEGDYYYDAVVWAVENGITKGTDGGHFSPNASCTRAQMATFLWRAAGSPAPVGENPFADVSSGAYYYDAVLWAVKNGITKGTSDTTFAPDVTVTRGQTVAFMYRYVGTPLSEGDNAFSDVASDAYYAPAVQWAVNEGITNGTSDTTFSPLSDCTRGQIVTFLYRSVTNE